MKNVIKLSTIVGAVALLASCASPMATGMLYTNTVTGLSANGQAMSMPMSSMKMGEACNTSVLSLFASGDASVGAAMRNGGIKNVATVDYTAHNVLGFYGTYCVVVKGS